ncbi:hypothetical protein JL107_07335 [Nakamurella flavida]|uniref:Uncharacterized protein n=1 Tax=Nakamurella flavida TaxID=363630 RepID=A0A939C4Z1_9ACTN|nr:hypothetical protein [Nakamurella flavida]MBM9476249.1 hypothetical protein [Nakamurella flavida]MDP9779653.1 hypothetical protein [Nakamurella flavida]
MIQLSHLSADLVAPRAADLSGLLAAGAHLARAAAGWVMVVSVDADWRARALHRELQVRDVPVEFGGSGGVLQLRTAPTAAVDRLAEHWAGGRMLPDGFVPGPGALRCWTLAAGRPDRPGFRLGLDPAAPQLHIGLAAACAELGLAASLLGGSATDPALRIVGRRRLDRLADLVGTPPPGCPPGEFPGSPSSR